MRQAIIKPFCRQCEYFYGHVHRGGALTCAVHPYGPEGESCPDWTPKPQPEYVVPAPSDREVEIVWADPDRSLWRKLLRRLRRGA